jgi:hypothetical protein
MADVSVRRASSSPSAAASPKWSPPTKPAPRRLDTRPTNHAGASAEDAKGDVPSRSCSSDDDPETLVAPLAPPLPSPVRAAASSDRIGEAVKASLPGADANALRREAHAQQTNTVRVRERVHMSPPPSRPLSALSPASPPSPPHPPTHPPTLLPAPHPRTLTHTLTLRTRTPTGHPQVQPGVEGRHRAPARRSLPRDRAERRRRRGGPPCRQNRRFPALHGGSGSEPGALERKGVGWLVGVVLWLVGVVASSVVLFVAWAVGCCSLLSLVVVLCANSAICAPPLAGWLTD